MRGGRAVGRSGGRYLTFGTLLLGACGGNPAPIPAPQTAREAAGTPLAGAAAFLDSALALGAAPGAVIAVSSHGHRWYYGAGQLGQKDATRPDSLTRYDMASVTKVVVMTTLAIDAVREGKLDLDAPIQRYVPAFQGPHKDSVTVRHLLTHSSGLPGWRALYLQSDSRAGAMALADTTPLDTLPGVRMVYSDLGIIVMTQALEGIYGKRLDSLFQERVARPFGMPSSGYLPAGPTKGRIAPTELDTAWRHRMLVGEVHDENAYRLDGVSGHAGLFSDAVDLLTFGEVFLRTWKVDSTTMEFARRQEVVPGSSRALGWDTPSPNGTAGHFLSITSVGHTGFTGPSIWMDPTRDLVIVVLGNRVHPTRANAKWGELSVRGTVADRVVSALEPGVESRP
jgi:CubicO group peptidase (beta-lactamase class C family)